MARNRAVNLTPKHATVLFWLGEITAGCAFALLMIALLFAPYLLGLLPEVDAEFMQGVR